MIKIKIFWIIIIILYSHISKSQSDFRPGYYITHNNDTIYGLIDYRGDVRNAKFCVYKKDKNSESKKFTPDDIIAYRFKDSKFYISKEVKSKDKTEVYFLEYLLNGIADLYYYRDPKDLEHHFFIEKENRLTELTNDEITIEIEGRGKGLKRTNKHIGLLKATFADCQEIQPQIEKTELDRKSLINIAKEYHDYVCDGEKCIIYEKKIPSVKIQVAPLIGITYNSINFSDNWDYSYVSFDKSINPSIGVMFKISLPRFNEKISFLLNTNINKDHFYGFSTTEVPLTKISTDIHLRTILFNISGGFNYTYPKGKFRPNIAAGGVINYLIKDNIKIIKEFYSTTTNEVNIDISKDMTLPTLLRGYYLQIGCDYHLSNKLIAFCNLKYTNSSGGITRTVVEEGKMSKVRSICLSIGMYF